MRLISIDYSEFSDTTYRWDATDFSLIDVNLIVGKNASGKSRLLRLITGLARFITGAVDPANILSGQYKVIFSELHKNARQFKIIYEISINDGRILFEKLTVDGTLKLDRKGGGRGTIFFEKNNTFIDIQVPETKLAVSARRDTEQHSFFEYLHDWANSVRSYEFSKIPQDAASIIDKGIKSTEIGTPKVQENVHLLFKLAKEKFGTEFINSIKRDMDRIGYKILEIGLMPIPGNITIVGIPRSPQYLYVIEADVDKKLPQTELSSGMFRALFLLIQIHVIRLSKRRNCIIVDDIGEGLDFDRSSKLISILVEQAEQGYSQLIMSTNDRFVMNKVKLDYWCVIERRGGKIEFFNSRNSPEKFREFEEIGFNNFDFFSRGFYLDSPGK